MIIMQCILCSVFFIGAAISAFENNPATLIAQITQEALDPLHTESNLIEEATIPDLHRLLFRNPIQAEEVLSSAQAALPEMHFDHLIDRILSHFISKIYKDCDRRRYIHTNEKGPIFSALAILKKFGATLDAKPMFYDFCLRRHDRYASVFPPESYGACWPDERDISEPEEPGQYLVYIHHEGRHSIRTILLEHLDQLAYKPAENRYPEENRIPHFFNEILNIFGEHNEPE